MPLPAGAGPLGAAASGGTLQVYAVTGDGRLARATAAV
jgi:hypothetical protein